MGKSDDAAKVAEKIGAWPAEQRVLVFPRNDDGSISFGLTEKAGFSTTDPLVASACLVNGLDADAERRLADAVRTAAG